MTDERRSRAGRIGAAARNARRAPGRSRLAAEYAHEHGVTLSVAAREFGCAVTTVSQSWRRLYPGRPAWVSLRGSTHPPVPVEVPRVEVDPEADAELLRIQRETVARIHARCGEWYPWHGKYPTTIARVAARYAALVGIPIADAARAVGADPSDARAAWRVIYPGQSWAAPVRTTRGTS